MVTISVSQPILKITKTVEDITSNANAILSLYHQSTADIIVYPELALTGYIPKDLLNRPWFIASVMQNIQNIVQNIDERILILPTPYHENDKLYNAALVIQNGKIISKCYKTHLPNYDIFDEKRYFSAQNRQIPCIFECRSVKIGLLICEDLWHSDVTTNLKTAGAKILISVNASPFDVSKHQKRIEILANRFSETQIPIIYCNQVACMDGILFDGRSGIFDQNGFKQICGDFACDSELITCDENRLKCHRNIQSIDENKILLNAIIFGLREFITTCGFSKVVIGLSGGADSALVAYLATKAFGPQNVYTFGLKTKYTSDKSVSDATILAQNLNVPFEIIDIEPLYAPFCDILNLQGLNLQNIQARVRGNVLMAKSHELSALLLTTGNKSEVATGYCTIYGDMCGAFNPIKDLYKTEVFELMRYINKLEGRDVIPHNIITKAPSAELAANQKDSDNLPEYAILDKILYQFIELGKSEMEIIKYGEFSQSDISRVATLILASEFKRRQSAPGIRLSVRSFEASEWKFNI